MNDSSTVEAGTGTTPQPSERPRAEAPIQGGGLSTRADTKPKLRGWLHLGMSPIIFIVGLAFTTFAPDLTARVGAAVYTLAAVQLFGTSAVYHRGNWSDRTNAIFRRIDHSNIFVFIAGTYTPLTLALLDGSSRWALLILIWSIAVLGVLFRVTWLSAPRWLYTLLYVAMGWAAVGWLNQFWAEGGPAVVLLLLGGGLVYSVGALAYGTKRPQLSPTWFGFHEVFHACTIIAAVLHAVAIGLAIF
ncbi:hemolysin III family protein [Tessaracoccus sp. ZS01]|uniref:PAQR family membrane homeostasis protein TrhA n=1 Tax=Tessaracoccus sp. ZS01 TaxID=1906324 RepID=UPI0009F88CE9|nr:hemolysin III family protein [Tessaracoccus sp. ZS01]MCG6566876.1 hemolysin [Tessaracoccus sp. ZS01]